MSTTTRDAVVRALRTFVIAFLAVLIPGLFGWLNDLTAWAKSDGQAPFPDSHSVAYLGISAILAGVIALVNLAWVWVENVTGKGLLRTPPTTTTATPVATTDPTTGTTSQKPPTG